jgi:hypothetical protein
LEIIKINSKDLLINESGFSEELEKLKILMDG